MRGVSCDQQRPPLPHDEDILKGEAVITGPSCPLHMGLLDSPDYWTDDALLSAVRPLNAEELHHMAVGSQRQKQRETSRTPIN